MRTIRALTVALTTLALVPAVATAQPGRPFKDSWFWGVKAGGLTYSHPDGSGSAIAMSVGADWLITRSQGGLYVSFSNAFLTDSVSVDTLDAQDTSAPHQVTLSSVRRVEIAAVAFPDFGARVHPYVGIGVAVNQIGSADVSTAGLTPDEQALLDNQISSGRIGVSPMAIVGAQVRVPFVSVFAHATFSSLQETYFLAKSSAFSASVEFGVRYNIGSSIDRQ